MDSRYLELLRVLIDQYPESVTSQVLAVHLSMTSRSVKTYIKEINELSPDTIRSSSKGYCVDANSARALLSTGRELVPQTARQRVSYILKALLKEPSVNKFDLCEELFVSISTLQGLLGRVKKALSEVDLGLDTEKDFLSIKGTEQNKRKLYSNVLYDECHTNYMDLKAVQTAFPEIDIHFIKETVDDVLSQYQFFVNDYLLTNLVLHIAIAGNRIKSGNINTSRQQLPDDLNPLKRAAAEKIVAALEKQLNIKYSGGELDELTLLMAYRVNFSSDTELAAKGVAALVTQETMDLVMDITKSVRQLYGVDLEGEYFLPRFALHVHNLLLRSQNYYYSKNPLTEGIRTSSPMIYEAAVYISSLIKERTGLTINDDEIAYIAMHLGNAICTLKEFDAKIKAVLYCPNYYDLNSHLAKLIEDRFTSELVLTNIYTGEPRIKCEDGCELVIATVPFDSGATPCVQVNVFFQGRSEADVRRAIARLQQQKQKARFEDNLRHIITPELFEVSRGLRSEREIIRHMVNRMAEQGYVEASFEDEVYARESISSTAFNGFAIPHSLQMNAHKTGMYILICPGDALWGEKKVRLVLMLCFKADERHIFHEIFDSLATILGDAGSYSRVIQCVDYEEFIHLVASLVE